MWLLSLFLGQAVDTTRYLLWRSASQESEEANPETVFTVAPAFPEGLTTGPEGLRIVLEAEMDAAGRFRRMRVLAGSRVGAIEAAMTAMLSWRMDRLGGPSGRTVQGIFVFRSMPADTPSEELRPIFRGRYEVEVRRPLAPSSEP